jgi:hypothetical protein
VGSLDIIVHLLENPRWRERAEKVKTLDEMRQILIDFCKTNGNVIQVDRETLWLYTDTKNT